MIFVTHVICLEFLWIYVADDTVLEQEKLNNQLAVLERPWKAQE